MRDSSQSSLATQHSRYELDINLTRSQDPLKPFTIVPTAMHVDDHGIWKRVDNGCGCGKGGSASASVHAIIYDLIHGY